MTRRPYICPTCQRPFPPPLVVHGPVRQRIVDLIANRPDGITRGEILDLVYADDIDGGPDNPNTISVLIKLANAELAPQGYQISPAWRGRGARYRLIRLDRDRNLSDMTPALDMSDEQTQSAKEKLK